MNLADEREYYINKLALDLGINVDDVRKVYTTLRQDSFIDYDFEKEIFLDE